MNHFQEQFSAFQFSGKTNVAIYAPENSPSAALAERIRLHLGTDYCVQMIDKFFLRSFDAMRKGWVDILIVPDLCEVNRYDFKAIEQFQDSGGALIMSASDLFMRGRNAAADTQEDKDSEAYDYYASEEYNYFTRTVAKIGIRPSFSDAAPTHVRFDTDFVAGVSGEAVEMTALPDGAAFNTTSNLTVPVTFWGAQFPERYEVTRNYEIVAGYDPFGRHMNIPVCFSQNWETGARRCLFASNQSGSFFHPDHPDFPKLLDAALAFCGNTVIAKHLQPGYACYRQGEPVGINYSIKNAGSEKRIVDVEISISGGSDTVVKQRRHLLPAKSLEKGEVFWMPDHFDSDLYQIAMKVFVDGTLVSKASNGFVVWDEQVVANGPRLATDGTYFTFNGKKVFLNGTNYYDSNQNAGMWVLPNVQKLDQDIRQMAEYGMRYFRPHYHPPKWFYDYYLDEYGFVPEEYQHLDESYLPSEKHWRTFDAHIYLCQKYGIIYGGDLLTLRPKELGDPRGWVRLTDCYQYQAAIECQKEFLKLVVARYAGVPGISWDIYNEPLEFGEHDETFIDRANAWGKEIAAYMRAQGERHTLCVGGAIPTADYQSFADFTAPHGPHFEIAEMIVESKLPQLYQEVWMKQSIVPEWQEKRVEMMRFAALEAIRLGMAGYIPWQWTQQFAMWLDSAASQETIDDNGGCCVNPDGSVILSGQFFIDFAAVINDLEVVRYEEDTLETVQGTIRMLPTKAVKPGETYFRLEKNGQLLRGLAKQSIQTAGFEASVDRDCDFWFFADGNGLQRIKPTKPCNLKLSLQKLPAEIFLTDPLTGGDRKLAWTAEGNTIALQVEPWQAYYWIRLVY